MAEPLGKRSPGQVVWDPLVVLGHWLLVATAVAAWLTRHGGGLWHEWLGYAALAIVAVRIGWGLIGSPHSHANHCNGSTNAGLSPPNPPACFATWPADMEETGFGSVT